MRITDMLVTCCICHWQGPCGELTMNDAEQWECDDTTACGRRRACLWTPDDDPATA